MALIRKPAGPLLRRGNLRLVATTAVRIPALVVQQMRIAVRGRELQLMREPMLKVDIESVVRRGSVVVKHADITESGKGPIRVDGPASGLRRAGVEVWDGGVLVRAFGADIGDVDDVGSEL